MTQPFRGRLRIKGTKIYADAFVVPGGGGGQTYEAAGQGRRSRSWSAPRSGPNAALENNLETLRARSRAARRNIGYADAMIDAYVTDGVGTGIKPRFATSDKGLNKELGELFSDWTDESDADGRGDFYGQQAMAVASMAEGGDCFTRLRTRRPEDGLSVPLQLQVLEGEYCPVERTMPLASGNQVINGVEFDLLGRRVAYWLYQRHPNDMSGWLVERGEPVRVLASDVCHLGEVRRPGQIRGEPWISRSLIKLRDFDAYDDAELVRKKNATLFTGFVTQDGDSDVFDGDDMLDDPDGQQVTLEPGVVQDLRPGEKIEFTEPTDVGANYSTFMRQQLQSAAAAGRVLYEMLSGDYSQVNDRTWRAAISTYRRRVQRWQHQLLVFQWCRPVVRRWLDLAILSGAIKLPAGMSDRDSRRVIWVPQGWAYIHPVQDVQAATARIQAGLSSRQAEVAAMGDDAEVIDEQQAADQQRQDDLGLAYTSDGRNAVKGKAAPPKDDGDGEDGKPQGKEG